MGAIITEVRGYDDSSLNKAREEYIAKYKAEPEPNNQEVIERAKEIFKKKLYALSTKYKKTTPPTVFESDEYVVHSPSVPKKPQKVDIPDLGEPTPIKSYAVPGYEYDENREPTVPKIPNPKNEEGEIIIDFETLKKKSVGTKKTEKKLSGVVLDGFVALLLTGVLVLGIKGAHTIIKTNQGSIGTFRVQDFEEIKWSGSFYHTWYEFNDLGREVIEQAFNNDEYSNLDINDAIAMIFGNTAYQVTHNKNQYGIAAHYSYDDASFERDGKTLGWAEAMYEKMKETAEEKGLTLPATLKEYLEQRGLSKFKYDFSYLTGQADIKQISDLPQEEQDYWLSVGGMLENLAQEGRTLQYRNGLEGVKK